MKKNFKISLRTAVVSLFIIIYSFSLIFFNSYFNKQQESIQQVYNEVEIDDTFHKLNFKTAKDTMLATRILNNYSQAKSTSNLLVSETKIYSTIYLFVTSFVALALFILIIMSLTKPLKELNQATEKIIEGDFSVHLKETGLDEIKQVKKSFNEMSQELDNIQKKLLESEKQIIWKEISRVLAHEIKNPLTPIQLSIQRLEDKYENDRDKFYSIFPEAAQMIYNEIDNLRNLATSFSKFAKVGKPNSEKINIIQTIPDILKPYFNSYKININIPEKCEICFDSTHFYQIFTNLIQNAFDAIHDIDGGEISINLKSIHDYAILEISDNGVGIDDEDHSRIFEPYFSKKKRGTGLGLALVKRLVESNNSYIRVKSKKNKGTTFEIYIPHKLKN